jgi:superfamily II DNA or RNA helicase/predicted  nucleic acid-binding Zn-ribbon protein
LIKLHGYQSKAVRAIDIWLKMHSEALMVMATGLGKTITIAWWVHKYVRQGKKVLFLCHDTGILAQATNEFRKVMGKDVQFGEFHGQQRTHKQARVLFASLQSMYLHSRRFKKDEFDIVIVDESHHGQAATYKRAITYFAPQYLIGMTATPDRMDERDIRKIFGTEVVNITFEHAVAQGLVPEFEYHVMTDNLSAEKLTQLAQAETGTDRRITLKEINESVFVQLRDEQVAREILKRGQKTIVFCENIRHVRHFQEFLPRSGVVHSRQNAQENTRILDAFRRGKIQFILAVNKLNEGIDVPDAELIVFYRATESNIVFRQQLGRGARGKPFIVLDFAANIYRVLAAQKMAEAIQVEVASKTRSVNDALVIEGTGFKFRFTQKQISLLDIIERTKPKLVSDIPRLVMEYSKKNKLPADKVIAGTTKKLLWRCLKCGHEWKVAGVMRKLGTGCPGCAGRILTKTNNLAKTHPELAREYSDKNELPANRVIASTTKKLWWECLKCGHEWRTGGYIRVRGSGCPPCAGNRKKVK